MVPRIDFFEVDDANETPRSWPWLGKQTDRVQSRTKVIKAALYAVQVFYSFFIMYAELSGTEEGRDANHTRLLFMSYNGFIMIAVAVGAFIGYLAFVEDAPTNTVACH